MSHRNAIQVDKFDTELTLAVALADALGFAARPPQAAQVPASRPEVPAARHPTRGPSISGEDAYVAEFEEKTDS